MSRLGLRLAALPGWARAALALALGALGSAALPPYHLVPVLIVAFGGLFLLIDAGSGWRAALGTGWLFGVGWFGCSLAWLVNAFMVDADRFGAFALPAVAGLAVGLALFPAAAAALARMAPRGWRRALALALAWTVMEWLRGHVLTGFPWNLVATVWAPFAAPAQLAALLGAYGLSFATVLIATLPWAGRRAAGGAVLLLGLIWLGGWARLPDGPAPEVTGLSLRIVQGNIAQHHKWRADLRQAHLDRYLALSERAGGVRPRVLIWPETAVPYFLDEEAALRAHLGTLVAPDGVVITGAVRRRIEADAIVALWNSVLAIDAAGAVVAGYDKAHLVPFGEYMPLRDLIPFAKLTQGNVDFAAGPGPVAWRLPGLPAPSPLICYEAIFPGAVTAPGRRPDWLLNVTNDAWFGISAGPYQHLAAARLRTIEEGLPLVRAANTGISAVIDPYGRLVAALDLGREGVVDAVLPAPLATPTVYARLGDGALAPFAVAALWLMRRARHGDSRPHGPA